MLSEMSLSGRRKRYIVQWGFGLNMSRQQREALGVADKYYYLKVPYRYSHAEYHGKCWKFACDRCDFI